MKTYLIFFGKSQDFKSVYFDAESKIVNFDLVIKDFDLLESNVFTVDDINNDEILSKYYFKYQNKEHSLLKLYSFAQAANGSRISGSIFGVGLLSKENISLCKSNLKLLKVAKDNFEKLSISKKKFNKSNFDVDVHKIWKAIVNNNGQNLLENIRYDNYPKEIKPKSIGIKLDFYESIESIDKHEILFNKVYFSSDIEHLNRTQLKWDKSKFPLFIVDNGSLKEYKEKVIELPKIKTTENTNSDFISLKIDYDDLTQRHAELKQDYFSLRQAFKKKELFYRVLISILFIALSFSVVYFSLFKSEEQKIPPQKEKVEQKDLKKFKKPKENTDTTSVKLNSNMGETNEKLESKSNTTSKKDKS